MVASALPGEGKSFTTMNLAFSISLEPDVTALLVDADVANPFISRTFGVEREPGLIDVLRDASLAADDVIIATDVPGLSILPAGQPVDTAVELLGSARMREVTRQLEGAASRRLVLFDSPPLLLTNESRVLCDMVGQILLVVRAGVTERSAVAQALGLLPAEKPVNLVLNQAVAGAADVYYGYGEYGSYPARST
jgi:Mrp family chromosome partitioning ATPase